VENKRRAPAWRGWIIALAAALVVAGVAYGIFVANGNTFTLFSPYPQIIGQNCGTISDGERGTSGDFAQAEQCLWNAYQTCHAATLVYSNAGLDFTLTDAVTVQKRGGACAVTDTTQGFQDGAGVRSRNTYHCASMEQQASGLVLMGCGTLGLNGSITIPAQPNQ
jgi:hypothetical protein